MNIPRPEYPRPDFVRENWVNLNGRWGFAFDDGDLGEKNAWQDRTDFPLEITVPFPYQSALSGLGDRAVHPIVWYHKTFGAPVGVQGKRTLLHFGAVDYEAKVWLNGELVGRHRGGYVPFTCDITEMLKSSGNRLVLQVEDTNSLEQPIGKQSPVGETKVTRYTPVVGIWQTVWLECVAAHHIVSVQIVPDLAQAKVRFRVDLSGRTDDTMLDVRITFANEPTTELRLPAASDQCQFEIGLRRPHAWSPEEPDLYDVMIELSEGGAVLDRVLTYLGMRDIRTEGDKILLNGEPIYLRFALDQGYWPEGIYTAPSDEAIRRDVELAKALGFNGVRKHQKPEDPRFYYWCDRLGLLVWDEMANCFEFSDTSMANFVQEWRQVVQRDWNHPCIIAWTPFNECWGIKGVVDSERQQEFVTEIVHLTRQLDPTRLIVDNSGYEHTETDIVDLHDYEQDPARLRQTLEGDPWPACTHPRQVMADHYPYEGQPIVISEYGGVGLAADAARFEHPGHYGPLADSPEDLAERYARLTGVIRECERVCGYTYTQLYDVEQEINGLLSDQRKPKIPLDRAAAINRP